MLACFDKVWQVLVSVGWFWHVLAGFGNFLLLVLLSFGWCWHTLAGFGRCWQVLMVLVGFDRFWLVLASFGMI